MIFNANLFSADLNSKLKNERFSLRTAANEIGVSASTLSRLSSGGLPEVEVFGKICKWLEEETDKYFSQVFEDEDMPKPHYAALAPDDVVMLRECGLPEFEIEGLNRYVQTIIDERDALTNWRKVALERMNRWSELCANLLIPAFIGSQINDFLGNENDYLTHKQTPSIVIPKYEDGDNIRVCEFCHQYECVAPATKCWRCLEQEMIDDVG